MISSKKNTPEPAAKSPATLGSSLKVMFTAAEMSPAARVGGLAEAAAGLVLALRTKGIAVDIVLPDYGDVVLTNQESITLTVPDWVGGATARTGIHQELGELTLVSVPGMERPHPYVEVDGSPWPDNDHRFFAFSAAVADLACRRAPDVLHLNDWHTAAVTSFAPHIPTVLTVHTLGYQGVAHDRWLGRLPVDAYRFAWHGGTNPMAGAISMANRVIAVSPTYAKEIVTEEHGMGLHQRLTELGSRLIGIRNGIDTNAWDPSTDPAVVQSFSAETASVRKASYRALMAEVGWDKKAGWDRAAGLDQKGDAVIGMVGRLVHQKGVDTLLEAARYLASYPARLVVLGSGEAELSKALRVAAEEHPDRIWFHDGYDADLARRIFAGSDFLALPSRFEPCGLAQMQGMIYGAVPIVNDVGGLHDTVVDDDADRGQGTGFVNASNDAAGLVDAMHRAVRAHRSPRRMAAIQKRGMLADWSWSAPADQHIEIYNELTP